MPIAINLFGGSAYDDPIITWNPHAKPLSNRARLGRQPAVQRMAIGGVKSGKVDCRQFVQPSGEFVKTAVVQQ